MNKGSRWIVGQIAAAFEKTQGRWPEPAGQRLSRVDVDELITQALEEELERAEPSPPAPLPQAGEG